MEELYRAYQRDLLLYLISLVKSRETAEDLTQETFLKAMLALPESHPNFRAWLFLVARNLAMAHLRTAGRFSPKEIPETLADAGPSPGEELLRDERNRLLYEAISHLGPRQRELMMLQYFGGLSTAETARLMGINAESVRVQGCRARKEIKSYLEERGYDDP